MLQAPRQKVIGHVMASRRFDAYVPVDESEVRESVVSASPAAIGIAKAWAAFVPGHKWDGETPLDIGDSLECVKGLGYSQQDVEAFSIALSGYRGEEEFRYKAWLFLDALIACGPEGEYRVHTRHIDGGIGAIGHNNTKRIVVEGSVNGNAGTGMSQGKIWVMGDAFQAGERMSGGEIEITGSVTSCDGVGSSMSGGRIIVRESVNGAVGTGMTGGFIEIYGNVDGASIIAGNIGELIGFGMLGGEIRLMGDIACATDDIAKAVISGKVYHRGVLIVDK